MSEPTLEELIAHFRDILDFERDEELPSGAIEASTLDSLRELAIWRRLATDFAKASDGATRGETKAYDYWRASHALLWYALCRGANDTAPPEDET